MLHYYVNRWDVVGYVDSLMKVFETDLRSITITTPEKSEVCSVLLVINSSSVDGVKEWTSNGYGLQPITQTENTQGGWFHLNGRKERNAMGENFGLGHYKSQDELDREWYHAGFNAGFWAGALFGGGSTFLLGLLSLYLLGAFA